MQTKKEIYMGKEDYARCKQEKNREIKTLSDEQHATLANLCRIRHDLHTNIKSLINSPECDIDSELIECKDSMGKVGLPALQLPFLHVDYFDIDNLQFIKSPDFNSPDDYLGWYNKTFEELYEQWSKVHRAIELYLLDIDSNHGTQYCPTGMSRLA
jgi:hypothetical protein